ncbi:acyloxyacyl hydrolase [Flavobacterium sp. NRK F10]|uniref:acyloxyacyl hydrolase n=1 Tax=Flavobacterium sp. NRK F10 TaxID=2954931 RepID=UPI0020918801|nr:acyloxyacyl hydrolase [Flavobacterium sp. NRK F10]MCO6175948.1 acyloxyacyl hydrolase [Flavobacterium sp. NRK F10]
MKQNYNLTLILFFILLNLSNVYSQIVVNGEYGIGRTSPANSFFPELKANQTASLSIGKKHNSDLAWSQELNHPETGLTFEYSNYGNNQIIGSSYSLLPYLELPFLKSKIKGLALNTAMGVSYFDKTYDNGANWTNKAVSTHFTWSYRMFLYYSLFSNSNLKTRLSLGYTHHSNGHVKWPNNGLNTFLLGLNFKFQKEKVNLEKDSIISSLPVKFFSIRTGIGQHSLSRLENKNKEVYNVALSYGKIYKNTYKVGIGLYYRFYESYYDYIKSEGYLINEEYPELKKNAFYNSSTYGVFINGELLLNHIAFEAELGFNIDKPFYKVDYRLNDEKYIPETNSYEVGTLGGYYNVKRFVAGKLGLKYYLLNTKNSPKHNLSIGASICSNLGQADYSELALSYTYCLK